MDKNWESIAPHLLDYNYTVLHELRDEISKKIRKHYFGTKSINKSSFKILTDLVGDRLFVADSYKAAIEQAKVNKSPVWFYYYSYRANQSISDAFNKNKENLGIYI